MRVTHRCAALAGLLLLMLVGCSGSDDSSRTDGQDALPETQSPLQPMPADTPTEPTTPVRPSEPERPDQPVQTPPGSAPADEASLPDPFYNGASAETARTAWQCRSSGTTSSGEFYTLVFYRNGTGYYENVTASSELSSGFIWAQSESEVSIDLAFNSIRIVLRAVAFTSTTQFTSNVALNDELSSPTTCNLAVTQSANTGSTEAMLINGTNFATRTSTWDCLLNDLGVGLVYLNNFSTMYFILPDSLQEFSWYIDNAGNIEHLSFAAERDYQFFIQAPVFSSSSNWRSARVYTESDELGTLECTRMFNGR